MSELSITVAFLAGVVSFLSPCVLPIIPGFLAYLAGASVQDVQAKRWEIFLNSLFFVLGFSLIFSILGVLLNTVFDSVAYEVQLWLARAGGVVIIIFGLYLTGLVSIPFLEREYKFRVKTRFSSRYLTSFVFGSAFAAGWTPCVGIVLGAVLGLAATQPGSAFTLLLAYSLGLGVPFLLVGAFTGRAGNFINRYSRAFHKIKVFFGVVLIVLGVLAFTGQLNRISSFELLNRFLLQ